MKIRIKGNSVRLRLSKSEVDKLSATKYLEERTSFGNNIFVYALQSKTDISELSAIYKESKIIVFIPESFIKDWTVNDVTGFDAKMEVSDTESLYILVEKDFQCLEETAEDQSDNYDNPNKTCR